MGLKLCRRVPGPMVRRLKHISKFREGCVCFTKELMLTFDVHYNNIV